MKYYCEFPHCNYKTNKKSLIHRHHIIPKELNGKDVEWNFIHLCPNHHNCIYVPESSIGIHSQKHDKSIIIKKWLNSGNNKYLEYINENNEHLLYDYKNKKDIIND